MPIAESVRLGRDVKIFHPTLVNLYGCTVGDGSRIGAFVEIQKNATVGARCKISSHTFICEGVAIEDEVFIGHGVMFTNDRFPRATNPDGSPQSEADWTVEPTIVRRTRLDRFERHDRLRGHHRGGCAGWRPAPWSPNRCPTTRSSPASRRGSSATPDEGLALGFLCYSGYGIQITVTIIQMPTATRSTTVINIGVVGYGYWGPNLVRNFAETPGMNLVAVADLDAKKLEVVQKRFPAVKTTQCFQDLLDDPSIDAIAIATPVNTHFELGMAVLKAGKHLWLEKPMTETSLQARKLVDEAEKRKLVLLVDHTFIYTGAVRKMAEIIRAGDLGAMLLLRLDPRQSRPVPARRQRDLRPRRARFRDPRLPAR